MFCIRTDTNKKLQKLDPEEQLIALLKNATNAKQSIRQNAINAYNNHGILAEDFLNQDLIQYLMVMTENEQDKKAILRQYAQMGF